MHLTNDLIFRKNLIIFGTRPSDYPSRPNINLNQADPKCEHTPTNMGESSGY